MAEAEKQEGQKTVVSFIAGLLIGGLLVWVFGGSSDEGITTQKSDDVKVQAETKSDTPTETKEVSETPTDTVSSVQTSPVTTGKGGELKASDQAAGMTVTIDGAQFVHDEGWIAVRSYENDKLGNILGAARFSKIEQLVPSEVPLLTPTIAGKSYAVVFFTEDGNREFNLSGDVQVEGVWTTFEAK